MVSLLDLFCGAGGMSLGLQKAGMSAVAALDFNKYALETYTKHSPSTECIFDDASKLDFNRWHGVDVVSGGPPCQPFSQGGKKLAETDARDMIPTFIRAIKEVKPRAFIMENVYGLTTESCKAYFNKIIEDLTSLGYTINYDVLYAPDYGVPQKRRRLFVVGINNKEKNKKFTFPEPTHKDKPVPCGDVLTSPRGNPNRAKVVYAKKPNLCISPFAGHLVNGGGRPLDLNEPAHTILAGCGNRIHFTVPKEEWIGYHASLRSGGKPRIGVVENARRLSVEECAAIQTFPPTLKFAGPESSQYKQIGNAVPPLLASIIGKELLRTLLAS